MMDSLAKERVLRSCLSFDVQFIVVNFIQESCAFSQVWPRSVSGCHSLCFSGEVNFTVIQKKKPKPHKTASQLNRQIKYIKVILSWKEKNHPESFQKENYSFDQPPHSKLFKKIE